MPTRRIIGPIGFIMFAFLLALATFVVFVIFIHITPVSTRRIHETKNVEEERIAVPSSKFDDNGYVETSVPEDQTTTVERPEISSRRGKLPDDDATVEKIAYEDDDHPKEKVAIVEEASDEASDEVQNFIKTGIAHSSKEKLVLLKWLDRTYPGRPYQYRGECRIVSLQNIRDLKVTGTQGRTYQFLDRILDPMVLPSYETNNEQLRQQHQFEPKDLWRVDLYAVLQVAAVAEQRIRIARSNYDYPLLQSLVTENMTRDERITTFLNEMWDAYAALCDTGAVNSSLQWRRDFCDKIPTAVTLLLDANDEERMLQLGVLLAMRYLARGCTTNENNDDEVTTRRSRELAATFEALDLDEHVIFVKLLMLRRMLLDLTLATKPIVLDSVDEQRERDGLLRAELNDDRNVYERLEGIRHKEGHERNWVFPAKSTDAILNRYNYLTDPRFLAIVYPNLKLWVPAMPSLAHIAASNLSRLCTSNGVCYDIDTATQPLRDVRVITYRREELPYVNHHTVSRLEDSFYLIDGTKYSVFRAGSDKRRFLLYRLSNSRPSINYDRAIVDVGAATTRYVNLELLHGYKALIQLDMYLYERDKIHETSLIGDNVLTVEGDSIYLNVKPYDVMLVLLRRNVFDPLRERFESSWLDIDTTDMSRGVITLNHGAVRLREFSRMNKAGYVYLRRTQRKVE